MIVGCICLWVTMAVLLQWSSLELPSGDLVDRPKLTQVSVTTLFLLMAAGPLREAGPPCLFSHTKLKLETVV